MVDLIEYTDHPVLHEPLMVLALDGWIDAGLAAGGALNAMLAEHGHELVASFDTDLLLDHRARRPMMSICASRGTNSLRRIPRARSSWTAFPRRDPASTVRPAARPS